jgi:cytochrome c-type biogenesis protein CcmH
MTGFLVVAVLLALGAVALVIIPLVRPRSDRSRPALITALACVVLVGGGAAALYPAWSTWSWTSTVDESSPEGMVGRLARRLEREPTDINGWLMLGRSYAQLGQYPLAVKAYRRADRLAGGRNSDALSGLGEALVLGEQSDLKGEAGRLFEKALEIDPHSIRALFYGAVSAYDRGETDLARTRFQLLLTGNPPPEVRRLIERQLQSMDVEAQQRAGAPAATAAPPAPAAATTAASATLRLRVTLDPAVAARASAGAPLFVSVRIAGQGGPPLAARRLVARFPQDVDLGAADAMIAGRGLTVGQEVEITARIANGGSAAPLTGDPVGSLRLTVGSKDERQTLAISRLTP